MVMLQRILDWFRKSPQAVIQLETPHPKRTIIEPQKYFCDVCKEPACHVAFVSSDTGMHAVGAKCDDHIGMVLRKFKTHGTNTDPLNLLHFVGFKSDPYTKWFECSCPKGVTHIIMSDDSRLLHNS
jgi:hypothetical protein